MAQGCLHLGDWTLPCVCFRTANYLRSIDYSLVEPMLIKPWAPLGPVHITPQRSALSVVARASLMHKAAQPPV